jgi:hypothetical protein
MYRLQDNKIASFEQELISNMPRLHHLNLSHNLLYELRDETFEKNEEMISLDISYNKFEYFNNLTFKGLEVLEVCILTPPPKDIYSSYIPLLDTERQSQCHKTHRQCNLHRLSESGTSRPQQQSNYSFVGWTLAHNTLAQVTDAKRQFIAAYRRWCVQ